VQNFMNSHLVRYVQLLDTLLLERALQGTLSDDDEEYYVVSMNDCRELMTPEEELQIDEIVALRCDARAPQSLEVIDTDPSEFPMRKAG